MNALTHSIALILLLGLLGACGDSPSEPSQPATSPPVQTESPAPEAEQSAAEFQFEADRFADIRILRYQVPGFENFTVQQKELLYYLSQAGMSGRDIMWDQNYKHNLRVRRTVEEILKHFPGDRGSEEVQHFLTYARQMWCANGIHHH